jgi:hypothetical protein
MDSGAHRVRDQEARGLGEIGRRLERLPLPDVEVRLPRVLAEAAARAWGREDLDDVNETPEQRRARHRAGTLALIGLAIKERGRWDGDEVVVPLNAGLVALAVDAADDLRSDAA